jgi:SAM-dependent methyltransferase
MGHEFDGTLDLICSFTVLEHVGDLEGSFADMARLLRPGGTAYHMVDVSDHTYQVFARWRALESINHNRALYHLRYSPGAFRILNDPKCYMNRELLPAYLAYARRHGLTVESLETAPYAEPFRIHPEVLARAGADADPAQLNVTSFSLRLRK